MPLHTKETEIHPIFLFDASSDFPSGRGSSVDHKLGENYLNLAKGRVVYSLTVHRQFDVRAIAPAENIFLKTKNILRTNVTESFQGSAENVATWKSLMPGTYDEPGARNHRIVLLTELNQAPLIKHGPIDVERGPADKTHEGSISFFEDMFDRPIAASVDQAEVAHAGLREINEEIQEEQYVSDKLFTSAELNDVLADLREVADEAREEGFPVPSRIAIANSEQLIKNLYEISPGRYGVYPTQDGEIAIDIFNGKGSSIILLCDSAGGTLCLVNIDGNRRRAHYSRANALPDGFVREALAELKL